MKVKGAEWMQEAACRDMDVNLFFSGERQREARAVCVVCPVRAECLSYAVDNSIHHGTWGGAYERRILRAYQLAQQSATSALRAPLARSNSR